MAALWKLVSSLVSLPSFYGAIAYDRPSPVAAGRRALQKCGSPACALVLEFVNGCGAYATGRNAAAGAASDAPDGATPAAFIVADVHYGLSGYILVDDVVASAVTARCGGLELPVPRGGLLFHVVFKLYMEGAFNYLEGAYQYADLCRLVPRLSEAEIAFFAERIAGRNLKAAGHYLLRRLHPEFGVEPPPRLAELVADWGRPVPTRSPASQNDWGDKLWGGR